MNINFGFTDELVNTSYAPLAALLDALKQIDELRVAPGKFG